MAAIMPEDLVVHVDFFDYPPFGAPLDVPPVCDNNCTELNTILQRSLDLFNVGFCTQLFLNDYASCFICLGGLTGASFDTPQQVLDGVVGECQQDGVTLSPIILPGEPSTAAAGPSSTPKHSSPLLASSSTSTTTSATTSSSTSSSPSTPTPTPTSTTTSSSTISSTLTPTLQSSVPVQTPNGVLPTPTQSSNSTLPSDAPPPVASDTSGSEQITVSITTVIMVFGLVLGFL
ncbi:hypothetical protein Clacol_008383 [Clathrus columnatus]|uniref:Uncharacterized protein n=1 Tax=Clathrus columnatus TaxID=1419009 RepID=A0AAV5AMJ1_9AGAM|nr:hypothetical protein Clacol_008383 [Clathrus columnatus]